MGGIHRWDAGSVDWKGVITNMKHDVSEIYKEALELPREARAALIGSLLDSLDEEVDENAESIWEAEIVNRIQDLDNGEVKTIPWSEVKHQLSVR
jgi:putative addiction module component (TIGR02574 family)